MTLDFVEVKLEAAIEEWHMAEKHPQQGPRDLIPTYDSLVGVTVARAKTVAA